MKITKTLKGQKMFANSLNENNRNTTEFLRHKVEF